MGDAGWGGVARRGWKVEACCDVREGDGRGGEAEMEGGRFFYGGRRRKEERGSEEKKVGEEDG